MIAFEGIGTLSAVVAYHGSYWDMLGAATVTPIIILFTSLCKVLHVPHLETIFVSFGVGLWMPLVWYYVSNGDQPLCHSLPQYVGPLICHLPGCQIIWGALELAHGSIIHGATRMVNGMFVAMLMAVFVCLGWQVWGRNWSLGNDANSPKPGVDEAGILASLPSTTRRAACLRPQRAGPARCYAHLGHRSSRATAQ